MPNQLYAVFQLAGGALRPPLRTAPYAAVAHSGVNPLGINVFLQDEVEPWKREQAVQMIAAAGFHWIRQEFPWEDIEIHGRNDFEDRRNEPYCSAWEKYDQIVGLAEQYGLEMIVRLSNPPAWSHAAGDAAGHFAPPDDYADFGDYVYAVVSRYRGRIHYYQLWNEPNIYPEWGEQPVDPEAYTRLLCEGYRRAHEADPDVVIVSGALAQTASLHPGPGPGTGLNELIFLQRMYDAGAAECFDIMAVNDYILWSAPADRRLPPPYTINFARPAYVRDIMVANGDADKPIWVSEMNSNAVPNDAAIQGWGAYGQVTLEQQARYAPLAYQRVQEEWPWMGVVNFWFFKRASDAERNQSWYYFRMVEPDFTPLPVYAAMQEYAAGLVPTLYRGTHQEDHWALAYSGDWETVADEQAILGSCRRAAGDGSAAVMWEFIGSGLLLTPAAGQGEIEVTVDDRAPRHLVLDGTTRRLFAGLAAARHTVRIRALSGVVAIDSLTVRTPDWGRVALVGLPLLVAGGWLVVVLVRRKQLATE